MFYYCTQYCNSVRMTCSIKRLLSLSYLLHRKQYV